MSSIEFVEVDGLVCPRCGSKRVKGEFWADGSHPPECKTGHYACMSCGDFFSILAEMEEDTERLREEWK